MDTSYILYENTLENKWRQIIQYKVQCVYKVVLLDLMTPMDLFWTSAQKIHGSDLQVAEIRQGAVPWNSAVGPPAQAAERMVIIGHVAMRMPYAIKLPIDNHWRVLCIGHASTMWTKNM